MVAIQHFKSIDTLYDVHNSQLQRAKDAEEQVYDAGDPALAEGAASTATDSRTKVIATVWKVSVKMWTRSAYETRGASMSAQAADRQEVHFEYDKW